MSCDGDNAMEIFLETPELLENFLPYLDLGTTLTLACSHEMTRKILQDSLAWNRLIRRNSPLGGMEEVQNFVEILKLMKEPKANMLDLLDAICKGPFPPEQWFSGRVQMGCPRHPDSPHLIPLDVFELLEQVEGAFDTTEQAVEMVKTSPFALDDPALSALGDRLSCQLTKVVSLSATMVFIRTRRSAEALATTMGASQEVSPILILWVTGTIGGEGWAALAEALQSHPGVVLSLAAPKEIMDEASREDLRKVWDALSLDGRWVVKSSDDGQPVETLQKPDGEVGWQKMEQIMDMSKDELAACVQMKMEDPNAWWKKTPSGAEGEEVGEQGEEDVAGLEDDGGKA